MLPTKQLMAASVRSSRILLDTFKEQVRLLEEAGVLTRINNSEWAAPTFLIRKKDGKSARFISDFCELNKRRLRKPYRISRIQDMLQRMEGLTWVSAIDLNMGYYHINLSPESRQLCTIVLPWGKYSYNKLPMGLCNSPDIFQEKMNELFAGFEEVLVYIDDILIVTKGSFADHVEKLERALLLLRDAGLKVNVKKSFFAQKETEYLGLTRYLRYLVIVDSHFVQIV